MDLGERLAAGGAYWARDGTIVFTPVYSDGLFRIPAEGGQPERLSSPDRKTQELGHWWPQVLPGWKHCALHGLSDAAREVARGTALSGEKAPSGDVMSRST